MSVFARVGVAGLFALGVAGPVFGHEGHHHHAGFADGFLHPLTGLDHLAVMLAVGALAARQGGANFWRLPFAFLAFMAGGALLALNGVTLPFAEAMILGSVAALAAALLFSDKTPGLIALAGCATFALSHGWAHAAEMPAGGDATLYLSGALLATGLLLAAGAFVTTMLLAAQRFRPR